MGKRLTLLARAIRVVGAQREALEAAEREIEYWKKVTLNWMRDYEILAMQFRIAIDQPEVDVREQVDLILDDMKCKIANVEEYVL